MCVCHFEGEKKIRHTSRYTHSQFGAVEFNFTETYSHLEISEGCVYIYRIQVYGMDFVGISHSKRIE